MIWFVDFNLARGYKVKYLSQCCCLVKQQVTCNLAQVQPNPTGNCYLHQTKAEVYSNKHPNNQHSNMPWYEV